MAKVKQNRQPLKRAPAKDLKGEIAQVLREWRIENNDTLEQAAKKMKMDTATPTNGGKASVFNIEAGHVFLPWKRVVSYAEYTRRDPAAVLIALAAARALGDIDDKQERERLRATLLERLELESLSDLLRTPDRSSVEAMRERVDIPKRFQFWRDFGSAFPSAIEFSLKFNPIQSTYAEKTLEEVFAQEDRHRAIIQDDGAEGIELTIKSYLDVHRRFFPVYIDAEELGRSRLDTFIDRQLSHLGIRFSAIADVLFLIIYNLPDGDAALRQLAAEVARVTDAHPRSRTMFLAQEREVLNPRSLGADSYLTIPFSRNRSLGIVRRYLKSVSGSSSTESFEDWTYLAIRHPLWLGLVCRLLSETNNFPSKWTMIREGATILTYGVGSYSPNSRLLFESVLGRKDRGVRVRPLFIQELARAAVTALGSPSETQAALQVDLKQADILSLAGPLVERVEGKGWRFTSTWIHYYFAALDYYRRIEKSSKTKSAIDNVVRDLSALFERGESQKIQAREIASALCHEADHYNPSLGEQIRNQIESQGPSHRLKAKSSSVAPKWSWHRRLDANTMTLRVMVEDQDPGFLLRRLAKSEELRESQDGRKDAMVVETILAPYSFLRNYIIDRALGRGDARKSSIADVIVSPHFSLAWELRDLAVGITNEDVPLLSKLGFLANHFCKSGGKWFGVPVQYPTKYLCYRSNVIGKPPTSLVELRSLIRKHKDESGRRILGLQCLPNHPSLYYEWLAFVVACGGGDVVWTDALGSGEIILDSSTSITATNEFLGIVKDAHRKSRTWDWDLIVSEMASGEIDMCLPFSDTVSELNRSVKPGELSYVPFQLREGLGSPYVSNRLVGLSGAPLHIFTAHIMVALNHHPEMKTREFRFMEWFLGKNTQQQFADGTKQLPALITETDESKESEERFSSRVAREYPFLPVQDEFVRDDQTHESDEQDARSADDKLSRYQMIVLKTISDLIEKTERGRPSSNTIEDALRAAASELRTAIHG